MATILKVNGAQVPLHDLSLPALQQAVGGYIQGVETHDNCLMYINEEGKLNDLPYNAQATRLYKYGHADPIVGDAVLCTAEETRQDTEA